MGLFDGMLSFFDDTPLGAVFGHGSPTEGLTNPQSWWESFKNGETNSTNKEIAEENLAYQRERNEIEDTRYDEETAYNRAFQEDERDYQRSFAEDERAYNRALQQRLFDREDTALSRQAAELSAMGINPASQQLNGLGAGQALSASSAGSLVGAPSASSRGGTALNNGFQMKDQGMLPILSGMLSLADTVNGVQTGQYQRDALALQNDKQFLENLKTANGLGIDYTTYLKAGRGHYTDNSPITFIGPGRDGNPEYLHENPQYKAASYSTWRQMKKDSMPSWQYTLDEIGQDDVYKQVERALTKGSQLFDRVYDNIQDKEKYSKNPFRTLFNLFF